MPERSQGILRGGADAWLHEILVAFAAHPARCVRDGEARRGDGLLQGHAVVDEIEGDVEDRVDDGGAAGRAVGGDGFAMLEKQ